MSDRLDIARVRAIPDPAKRAKAIGDVLAKLGDLIPQLRADRQAAVQQLRADGWSHQQVADALGISRGRAQQIAEGRATGRRRAEPES